MSGSSCTECEMATYSDILIESDDLSVDENCQTKIIEDRSVILQDLIHAIRESGYLVEMIAERDDERQRLLQNKIIELAEDDPRIIPGTVVFEGSGKLWILTAETYEFGKLRTPVWG